MLPTAQTAAVVHLGKLLESSHSQQCEHEWMIAAVDRLCISAPKAFSALRAIRCDSERNHYDAVFAGSGWRGTIQKIEEQIAQVALEAALRDITGGLCTGLRVKMIPV